MNHQVAAVSVTSICASNLVLTSAFQKFTVQTEEKEDTATLSVIRLNNLKKEDFTARFLIERITIFLAMKNSKLRDAMKP